MGDGGVFIYLDSYFPVHFPSLVLQTPHRQHPLPDVSLLLTRPAAGVYCLQPGKLSNSESAAGVGQGCQGAVGEVCTGVGCLPDWCPQWGLPAPEGRCSWPTHVAVRCLAHHLGDRREAGTDRGVGEPSRHRQGRVESTDDSGCQRLLSGPRPQRKRTHSLKPLNSYLTT